MFHLENLLQFPAMRALSISSADAFILVYDVTDAATFEEARTIRDQIHETKATTAVPIVVVGNKIDLLDENSDLREVSGELHIYNQRDQNGQYETETIKTTRQHKSTQMEHF